MPSTSLSAADPKTTVTGRFGKCRARASTSRSMLARLWAPSMTVGGVPGTYSIRPGHTTRSSATRTPSGDRHSTRIGHCSAAARAVAALTAWCSPISGRKSPPYVAAGVVTLRATPSRPSRSAGDHVYVTSRPTTASGAPVSRQARSMTRAASSGCGCETTGTPGLMMPAFSAAIAASVSPSCSVWSRLMAVMTATSGARTFVASSRPPRPTSTTARSTPTRSKWSNARAVKISKKVGASPSPRRRSTEGRMAAIRAARSSCEIIRSPTRMRSRRSTRCGDV